MKNKYGLIIFIFIILLVLSEAYLFFAKDSVATFFNNQEDLAALSKPIKISPSANAIDDSVVRTEKFKGLKNNVNNFEFSKICERSAVAAATTETVSDESVVEATSTPVQNINCKQGNNNPFLINPKK